MKILYLAVFDRKRDIGVYHKIKDQLKGFGSNGIEARLVNISQSVSRVTFLNHDLITVYYGWENIRIDNDIEALYIRYNKSSFGMINFLRKFKAKRSDRKIIIELPTYPYDGESNKEEFLIDLEDKVCRRLLKRYVDRLVTYSTDREIFGIRTIRTINGINFDDVALREVQGSSDEINMIAVASMKPWHGYERIIVGIKNYYHSGGRRKICLHLVGSGPEVPMYKQLVKQYGLEEQIKFYGVKEGEALQSLYNRCDVGLVGFGYYKTGIHLLSAIKTREYAAMGLPMVIAGRIDIFPASKYQFILEEAENGEPVNIERLIHWYDELYGADGLKKQEVAEMIRAIALKKCDSKITMKAISRYFYSG